MTSRRGRMKMGRGVVGSIYDSRDLDLNTVGNAGRLITINTSASHWVGSRVGSPVPHSANTRTRGGCL